MKTKKDLFFTVDYLRNRNYELKRELLDLQEYVEKLEKQLTKIMIKDYDDIFKFLDNIPISVIDDKVHDKVDAIALVKEHLQEDWVKEKMMEEIK